MPRLPAFPSYPSVTEILAAVGLTRSYRNTDPRYAQLGTALHETIAWHHAGTLDESTIHPEVKPGYEAYLDWCQMANHVPRCSELELVHPHGFVGHIDRVGSVGSVETALIDWAYSNNADVKGKTLQCAGYRLLWDHVHPECPIERCYVVQLGKDGVPQSHDVTDDYAMTIFNAALIVERAKRIIP